MPTERAVREEAGRRAAEVVRLIGGRLSEVTDRIAERLMRHLAASSARANRQPKA